MATNMQKPLIETLLYRGDTRVRFFPESHIYTVNGKRATGVTTYIGIKDKSEMLLKWAMTLCQDYLLDALRRGVGAEDIWTACQIHSHQKREAGLIGDLTHEFIEKYIRNESPEVPEFDTSVMLAVSAFTAWATQHKDRVTFVSTERVLYSERYGYTGKMDCEIVIDGYRFVVDFKTCTTLHNEVRMQTAAYQKADEEERGIKYDGRLAIRLTKETGAQYEHRMKKRGCITYKPYQIFEVMMFENDTLEDDFNAFLNCKGLYEWDKRTSFHKKPKNAVEQSLHRVAIGQKVFSL